MFKSRKFMIATVAGATGLTGKALIDELLEDTRFQTVRVLVRRPFLQEHPKLEVKMVDFEDADSLLVALANTDVLFCAVGTTQRKVGGDKTKYRKVDHDIPVNLARYCSMLDIKHYVVVSSVGASSSSKNFYLQLKGEMEEAVMKEGPANIQIMHPSILIGNRHEFRPGEKFGIIIMKAVTSILPWKYKPAHVRQLARKMTEVCLNEGRKTWEGKELLSS